LLTVHTLGGLEMMKAARAVLGAGVHRPRLLGVTILTSMQSRDLAQVGIAGPPSDRVVQLAFLAKDAGLDGVVASAHEVEAIRRACGPRFLVVVPGIRPVSAESNDQTRVATPEQAIRAGADFLVVGRPVSAAPDPAAAARAIAEEIRAARQQSFTAVS
jgi:orotidine-5'-phosphate decarboxylase